MMRILFHYTKAGAAFVLPLDVDERRPFVQVENDAHEIAREIGACVFRTMELSREHQQ